MEKRIFCGGGEKQSKCEVGARKREGGSRKARRERKRCARGQKRRLAKGVNKIGAMDLRMKRCESVRGRWRKSGRNDLFAIKKDRGHSAPRSDKIIASKPLSSVNDSIAQIFLFVNSMVSLPCPTVFASMK